MMFSAPNGLLAVDFTIHGETVPGGTVRPVPIRKGGEVVASRLAPGRDKKAGDKINAYLGYVAEVAAGAMAGRDLLTGPLLVRLDFQRPRIAGHYGTGRNAGKVKGSAPLFPITRPDLGKLARLVEDGMSGVVYRDDSQIVHEILTKRFGPACCHVEVHEFTHATVGQQLPEAA